jgi:hypothetical protein
VRTVLTKLWRWLRGPELTPRQAVEVEKLRREQAERREKVVDEYYEEGFPSRDAVKGSLWIP